MNGNGLGVNLKIFLFGFFNEVKTKGHHCSALLSVPLKKAEKPVLLSHSEDQHLFHVFPGKKSHSVKRERKAKRIRKMKKGKRERER